MSNSTLRECYGQIIEELKEQGTALNDVLAGLPSLPENGALPFEGMNWEHIGNLNLIRMRLRDSLKAADQLKQSIATSKGDNHGDTGI